MTTIKTRDELIQDLMIEIKEMDSSEIFDLNNRFCDSANYSCDQLFMNDDEFFEIFFSKSIDAVRAVHFGDYNWSHDFVMFDGYGNLQSYSYLDYNNLPDMPLNIAEYIVDNFNEFSDLLKTDINEYETE
jgi:hypothetical protein